MGPCPIASLMENRVRSSATPCSQSQPRCGYNSSHNSSRQKASFTPPHPTLWLLLLPSAGPALANGTHSWHPRLILLLGCWARACFPADCEPPSPFTTRPLSASFCPFVTTSREGHTAESTCNEASLRVLWTVSSRNRAKSPSGTGPAQLLRSGLNSHQAGHS